MPQPSGSVPWGGMNGVAHASRFPTPGAAGRDDAARARRAAHLRNPRERTGLHLPVNAQRIVLE